MALKDDLKSEVIKVFREHWQVTQKRTVPAPKDLALGNHAGYFESATVLYADLNGSTSMVDRFQWNFSAEVYKTYLLCAAKIIKARGGIITAYDGDRIMAIFTCANPNTSAVRCALHINHAIKTIINPELKAHYPGIDFEVRHVIGIDTSAIYAARIGVRGEGDNDIVWVGRAANYAAKLTALADYSIRITGSVYDRISASLKAPTAGAPSWEQTKWIAMNSTRIYRSNGALAF